MKTTPLETNESPLSGLLLADAQRAADEDVTVVVPCCNEVDSLPALHAGLTRLRAALKGRRRLALLLVDDGSSDETMLCMRRYFGDEPDVTLLSHATNRGIAAAIATGIRHARTEVVATLDADCTYDPLTILPMLPLLADDVDMVVTSPYHPHGAVEGVAGWRLALSRLASRLYSLVMRNKLHTYTSCVRVYRRDSVVDLPLANEGFVGVVELLWQLDRRGGKIVECPALLRARATGVSKMRVLKTTLAHGRFLARAARHRLLGLRFHRVPSAGLARL